MSKREEFQFLSDDGRTRIHAIKWIPNGPVKAIVHMMHGMCEHMERYTEFAEFLNQHGILAVGGDCLGHGKSVESEADYGHFSNNDGGKKILEDIKKLQSLISEEYPQVPYFMLGHSMGSFFLRRYICGNSELIQGAVIIGTGNQSRLTLWFGQTLLESLAFIKGWKYRSPFVTHMMFKGYNDRFKPTKTAFDWLSGNEESVMGYANDPKCGFHFSLKANHDFLKIMKYLKKSSNIKKIREDLPILLLTGQEDPVGAYGKFVPLVAESYKKSGLTDVTCNIYKGQRHEILQDLGRKKAFEDILNWIEERIKQV